MLRFQQFIELIRAQDQAKLVEAIGHARKFLYPLKDSYPKEVQQACGALAFPPGTQPFEYEVSVFYISAICFLNPVIGSLRSHPLEDLGEPLHANTQQPISPPISSTPPYRSISWPLSAQDTILPFLAHLLYLAHIFFLHYYVRLPHLQYRAQRSSSECSICTSHQKSCGERFGIASKWLCVWKGTIAGIQQKGWAE
jgi:hypothetical protein